MKILQNQKILVHGEDNIVILCSADLLLDDFLVAENSPFHSDANSPGLTSERGSNMTTLRTNDMCPFDPISHDEANESLLPTDLRLCSFSLALQNVIYHFVQPTLFVFKVQFYVC